MNSKRGEEGLIIGSVAIHYSPFTIHRSIASFLIYNVQEGVPVQVPPEIFAE